eukprot:1227199-Ditylum_brightwellii.AAC.1
MRACVDVIAKNPIAHVEKHQQQFAIDAFVEEFAWMQFYCTTKPAIARYSWKEFWENAASMKSIFDGHICIYQLLDLYKSYLRKNMYDDLMMVNKFELELLTQVPIVPVFDDPHELGNIHCSFYCYKCKQLIRKTSSGFSATEVT